MTRDELRRLSDAATQGEWHVAKDSQSNRWEIWCDVANERICRCKQAPHNAAFILAAVNEIRRQLADSQP